MHLVVLHSMFLFFIWYVDKFILCTFQISFFYLRIIWSLLLLGKLNKYKTTMETAGALLWIKNSESVVRRCSVKKVFLEILQNSQENACARVSFLIKLQVSGLQLY